MLWTSFMLDLMAGNYEKFSENQILKPCLLALAPTWQYHGLYEASYVVSIDLA